MDTIPENKLTEQLIDETSDDKLVYTVFHYLFLKLDNGRDWKSLPSADYQFERMKEVNSWRGSPKGLFMLYLFESEINNGGFHQFYYNGGGIYAQIIPLALSFYGAEEFVSLTEAANKIYYEREDKCDGSSGSFFQIYPRNTWDEYDTVFHKLNKKHTDFCNSRLKQYEIQYIRQHKQDFIDEYTHHE